MADKPLEVYLNDHWAGSTLGVHLAEQLRDTNKGTPLGDLMAEITLEISQDRQILEDLIEALGVDRNLLKSAGAWVTEKASRVKFSGLSSGEPELGNFMALESLALGVKGKWSLWVALAEAADEYPQIRNLALDELAASAERQYEKLERERRAAARRALANPIGSTS